MKRIDIVYNKLLEVATDQGIDANSLSKLLNISRANISFDLNRLWDEGKVAKSNGRPVLFSPIIAGKPQNKVKETALDKLAKKNKSLKEVIEQAKAAILYPPKGMHCLILGDTGVGKSMFADFMHSYAVEMGIKKENAPFIVFNCADYSNNPQLLTAQLFGVKKGAFTGAESDKEGLVQKADGGILFLDEVHRLPPEGQEAFFTFMDKGFYRRVGETDLRTSDVLIISATTEDPSSALLKTFTRRIPMTIRIPSLYERSAQERLELIKRFFQYESERLDRDIFVSLNTMRAMISYDCPNNIGQLKSDVQLICAKAYSDFLTNKKEDVRIYSSDLPNYIREGLYTEKENRMLWNEVLGEEITFFKFTKNENNLSLDRVEDNIYDVIDKKVNELKQKGVSYTDIETILEKDITFYFQNYINNANGDISRKNLLNIIGYDILKLVDKVFSHACTRLRKNFSTNTFSALALHINTLVERLNSNKNITNPQLNFIKKQYPVEFEVATVCVKIIESYIGSSVPEDEAGFITLFWISEQEEQDKAKGKVKVILIAHGDNTASSMADVANKLLGENYAIGINAPIEVSPLEVLSALRAIVKNDMNSKGYLLLVDMGSLTTFGQTIQKEFNLPVKVIPLVSTLHVIEATRKALLGLSLEDIYSDVLSVNSYLYSANANKETDEGHKKLAIVTACLTGEGSAIAIKSFLNNNLKYDKELFDIIPINCLDKQHMKDKLQEIQNDREILFIVSSFHIDIDADIKQYSVHDVISLRVTKELQEKIEIKTTLIRMGTVLSENIPNIDGKRLYTDISDFLSKVEENLNVCITEEALPGIILHAGFMLGRIINGDEVPVFENKDQFISVNTEVYDSIKESMQLFKDRYFIEVTDDEICYMTKFFV
jgi:transcriptional regulatory protein LevR/transcriptional regulator with AAA-type ATPase domain